LPLGSDYPNGGVLRAGVEIFRPDGRHRFATQNPLQPARVAMMPWFHAAIDAMDRNRIAEIEAEIDYLEAQDYRVEELLHQIDLYRELLGEAEAQGSEFSQHDLDAQERELEKVRRGITSRIAVLQERRRLLL